MLSLRALRTLHKKAKLKTTKTPHKFGAFLGVYTTSILIILGLVYYVPTLWVVGNVGLINTIVIVLQDSSITFITGLRILHLFRFSIELLLKLHFHH